MTILALDVDGVIIDGFPRRRWDEDLYAELGISVRRLQEEFFKPHWQEVMRGLKPVEEPLTEFLENYGADVTTEEFLAYWHGNDASVQQGVIDAALAWRDRTGGHLAVATNQDLSRARYLREDLRFDDHFDTIIASCYIQAAKPEPEYFQRGDELMGRQPGQEVIFIDDMKDHVEAARAHGWQAHRARDWRHAIELIESL